MFGRRKKFEPDGLYNGFRYQALAGGKIAVDPGDGRIVQFKSVEEMIARLSKPAPENEPATSHTEYVSPSSDRQSVDTPPEPLPKKKKGCGCLTMIIIVLAGMYFLAGGSGSGDKAAEIINSQFGQFCEAKAEGVFSDTLRLDWKSNTTKLHTVTVIASIGKAKETLYSKGIRYLKFPNDAGGYNIIDWKTGEKTSTSERAPYYFRN